MAAASEAVRFCFAKREEVSLLEKQIQEAKAIALLGDLCSRLENEGMSVHGPRIEMELFQESFDRARNFLLSGSDCCIKIAAKEGK
jgi:hypothetical protein